MDLVAEIDRAVLELPEDLQVVWMRFRPLVFDRFHFTNTAVRGDSPAMCFFSWSRMAFGKQGFAADLYWPPEKHKTVSGDALEVARGITEFFQTMTRS